MAFDAWLPSSDGYPYESSSSGAGWLSIAELYSQRILIRENFSPGRKNVCGSSMGQFGDVELCDIKFSELAFRGIPCTYRCFTLHRIDRSYNVVEISI